MILRNIFMLVCIILAAPVPSFADSIFFEDEPVQSGVNVFDASATFADIYQKLDDVKWGGKSVNVAIESLEKLNKKAHIAATDERVVLVWGDAIIANYPRPAARDWNGFGEITTALVLKMRERDDDLRRASESALYQQVVGALMAGIDENGRYIYSRAAQVNEDNRLLTSMGILGARDERGNYRVTGVYKGAPADAAGIRAGDLISEINGRAVPEIGDAELDGILSGFNSGTAKVTLLTPGGARRVVLRRATVVLADADIIYRRLNDTDGGVLEIVVHNVSDSSASLVHEALLQHPDARGIILDLRNATGDDAAAAAKLAGLFIGALPVMRIAQTASEEVEVVPGGDAVTDAPVVVLLSDQTRGTGEALAAAMYEHSRGVLVGTPTGGVARIASRIDLLNGGALELMNKSIKTGTGRPIDARGVFPIVCLSNIRSASQQDAFFLNVLNGDFRAADYNARDDVAPADIRRGCPVITSGTDEDNLSSAVAVKILTDKNVYHRLMDKQE
ncbi:PDZ domain-containing protein [bacterium]|nr:PDZ domain-containing protein [bacterium]